MARADGRLEPGQPLRGAISARAWNRALDAADLVLGVQTGTEVAAGSAGAQSYTTVLAWNGLGRDAEIGDVMVLDGQAQNNQYFDYAANAATVVYATDSAASVARNINALPGATSVCVAVEPIKANKIGRVAVSGVVLAKVDTTKLGAYFPNTEVSYGAVTGQGLVSRRTRYLSFNDQGVLSFSEIGPAVFIAAPKNANGVHVQPEQQPEMCFIRIGHVCPTLVRIGRIASGPWELGTSKVLFDVGRGGVEIDEQNGKFVAWNNFKTLTLMNSGYRLVSCALDLNMEWQLIAAAPDPEITEVITDIVINPNGTVASVTRKSLF